MSLILAWVLFPLVLGAVGVGWGALVERARHRRRRRAADPARAGGGARRRGHDHGLQRDGAGGRHGRRRGRGRGARPRLARAALARALAAARRPRASCSSTARRCCSPGRRPSRASSSSTTPRRGSTSSTTSCRTRGRSAELPPSTYSLQLRPRQPGLSARRLHAARRRPRAHGGRHRVGLPALPGVLRGGAGAVPVRADGAAGRLAAAAGAAGVRRRPGRRCSTGTACGAGSRR